MDAREIKLELDEAYRNIQSNQLSRAWGNLVKVGPALDNFKQTGTYEDPSKRTWRCTGLGCLIGLFFAVVITLPDTFSGWTWADHILSCTITLKPQDQFFAWFGAISGAFIGWAHADPNKKRRSKNPAERKQYEELERQYSILEDALKENEKLQC